MRSRLIAAPFKRYNPVRVRPNGADHAETNSRKFWRRLGERMQELWQDPTERPWSYRQSQPLLSQARVGHRASNSQVPECGEAKGSRYRRCSHVALLTRNLSVCICGDASLRALFLHSN